jgi:hypothetical protein
MRARPNVRVWQVPARRWTERRAGTPVLRSPQIGSSVDMGELIALSLLAGLGLGLAFARGDPILIAVFGAASAMAIIGGMRRFP